MYDTGHMRSVTLRLDATNSVEVEVTPVPGYQSTSTTGKQLEATFDTVLDAVRAVGERFGGTARRLLEESRPDSVELTIGVKLTAEAGVILAKTASEAQFAIKIIWKGSGDGTPK